MQNQVISATYNFSQKEADRIIIINRKQEILEWNHKAETDFGCVIKIAFKGAEKNDKHRKIHYFAFTVLRNYCFFSVLKASD